VENSFKHGTSKMLSRPEITLHISLLENILHFKLANSKPPVIDDVSSTGNRGLGLKNVKKRLALLYPRQHELQIINDPSTFTVWLRIVLSNVGSLDKEEVVVKQISEYELA